MDDVWVYPLARDLLGPSHLGWKDARIALFRRCWSARATLLLHFVRTIGVLRVWFASLPTFICSFHNYASAIHVIVVYTQVELEYVLNRHIALSSGRLISYACLFGDLLRIERSSHAGWWLQIKNFISILSVTIWRLLDICFASFERGRLASTYVLP